MGKNDRLSRDQKRKLKLKKRDERSRKPESLAYHGKKYRSAVYVPIMHKTEIGIFECYVMCDRELTDNQVEAGLVKLIGLLREGVDPALPPVDHLTSTDDNQEEFVIQCVRRRWRYLEEEGMLPARDDLIGILRTILSSLETWRGETLHAQSYLRFLEGFMKETGVNVKMLGSAPSSLGLPPA